jgi:hypothetical protein
MAAPDPPPGLPEFQGRIFIDEDGQVVFENLDPELAEVALELDPEALLACDLDGDEAKGEGD